MLSQLGATATGRRCQPTGRRTSPAKGRIGPLVKLFTADTSPNPLTARMRITDVSSVMTPVRVKPGGDPPPPSIAVDRRTRGILLALFSRRPAHRQDSEVDLILMSSRLVQRPFDPVETIPPRHAHHLCPVRWLSHAEFASRPRGRRRVCPGPRHSPGRRQARQHLPAAADVRRIRSI
jgi:hypothetical protein